MLCTTDYCHPFLFCSCFTCWSFGFFFLNVMWNVVDHFNCGVLFLTYLHLSLRWNLALEITVYILYIVNCPIDCKFESWMRDLERMTPFDCKRDDCGFDPHCGDRGGRIIFNLCVFPLSGRRSTALSAAKCLRSVAHKKFRKFGDLCQHSTHSVSKLQALCLNTELLFLHYAIT